MSISAMKVVWAAKFDSSSTKLCALSLADWCDDNGERLFPSVRAVARKISLSKSQARRLLHILQDMGYLEVLKESDFGGEAPSRRYRLNLAAIRKSGDPSPPGGTARSQHLDPPGPQGLPNDGGAFFDDATDGDGLIVESVSSIPCERVLARSPSDEGWVPAAYSGDGAFEDDVLSKIFWDFPDQSSSVK